jgi:hypothetical protein
MRTVAIVLALVLVGIGIYYVASAPFKTKVNEAISQTMQWTPENIAKQPQDYIRWAIAESETVLESTKAREVAIAQLEGRWKARAGELEEASNVGQKALDELKQLYRDAEASGDWAVTWRGRTVESENDLKRQIIALHNEVGQNDALQGQYEEGVQRLLNMKEKVKEVRFKAQETIKNLQYALEEAKLDAADMTIDQDLVAVNETLTVLRRENTEIGTVDLDTLVREEEATIDDAAFAEIMGVTPTPAAAPQVEEAATVEE